MTVLEAARKNNVDRVVYASSSSVYGKPEYLPCGGCHRTVLMAIDVFSVIGSEPAVYGLIEITVAMLNYAKRAIKVIIRK